MARRHARLWTPGSQQDTDSKPRPVRTARPSTPMRGEFQNDPRRIADRENCLMLALEEDGVVFVRGLAHGAWWQPEEWRAMREAPSYRVVEVHGQNTVVFPFVQ